VRVGGRTDIGSRWENDDHLLIDSDLGLFGVLDAGGSWAENGGRASRVGAEVICRVVGEGITTCVEPRTLIERAFRIAGDALRADTDENGWWPSSSVVVALLHAGRVHVFWLGDSMAYRITGGQIEPLTRAHTIRNELIRQGRTSEAEQFTGRAGAILVHVLGPDTLPDPFQVISFTPQPGDRLILTTNGIHDVVPPAEFPLVCLADPDPQRCADQLVQLALDRGSRDNCTCVVVTFEE
jgi:protein phosphatase